jgi:hypothetical protein
MIEYRTLIGDRTLEDLMSLDLAQPFSDTLWLLNETEHGTQALNRLYAFGELLAHPDRTPEIDRELIIPFLVRYLWEVPYPAYTAAAWTHLSQVVEDTAELADLAHDILTSHPHGALRAEVLRWDEDYSIHYLTDDERFRPLITQLLRDDPAPCVRAAAATWMFPVGHKGVDQVWLDRVLAQLANDPAAEVRARLFDELAGESTSALQTDQVKDALVGALNDPANRSVMPGMLRRFAQRHLAGLDPDPDMVALLLNRIAAEADHPRRADLQRALAWLEPEMGAYGSEASRLWLQSAPYEDGAALASHALALFRDPDARPEVRAHALAMLSQLGHLVAVGEIELFLMAENQTAAALDATIGATRLMDRLLASTGCDGTVLLLSRLMEHARARADRGEDEQAGNAYAKQLCDRAMRLALDGDASQRLLDEVLKWIAVWPGDLTTALRNLIHTEADVQLEGVRNIALNAACESARAYSAGILSERYAASKCRQSGELLVEILSATRELEVAKEIFAEMPPRASLSRGLARRLVAASDWVAEAKVDPDDWLPYSQQQVVMDWRQ